MTIFSITVRTRAPNVVFDVFANGLRTGTLTMSGFEFEDFIKTTHCKVTYIEQLPKSRFERKLHAQLYEPRDNPRSR